MARRNGEDCGAWREEEKNLWTAEELESLRKSLVEETRIGDDGNLHRQFDDVEWRYGDNLFSEEDWTNLLHDFQDSNCEYDAEELDNVYPKIGADIKCPPSGFTYKIDRQRRPGTHHGRGGRPRSLAYEKLQNSISPQIASKICRFMTRRCGGRVEYIPVKMKEALLSIMKEDLDNNSATVPQEYSERLKQDFRDFFIREKSGYEIFADPILMVCSKVQRYGNVNKESEFSMDKHFSCSWIDRTGGIHCTCIGSTQYRARINCGMMSDNQIICSHMEGILLVVRAVSRVFGVSEIIAAKILYRVCLMTGNEDMETYVQSLPRIYSAHKGSVIVVVTSENRQQEGHVMFVPVRHITKGSLRNVCAFCDNVLNANCHHTRTISIMEMENEDCYPQNPEKEETASFPNIFEATIDSTRSISHLPVSPVNCARSLIVDEDICRLTRNSKPFILSAPLNCFECGSKRSDESRKMWTEGVVMCTIGPCKLHVEEFTCGLQSCRRRIVSEGREHCIVMEKISSAATHALMRRELYGVAVSNGTLTGRLSHFHSLVSANAYFGLIPSDPSCRSVRTLMKLCSVMLRLICMDPPSELFRCLTCEFNGGTRRKQLNALCMDGVSQGFVKGGMRPFHNISEPCVALKPSTYLTRGRAESQMRPLIGLVRETKPVSILLRAIRGKRIACNKGNEKDFASAVKMVSETAIPSAFYSSISVCGRSRGDISNDVGDESNLHRIKKLVTSLFQEDVLLYRLLIPLRAQLGTGDVRNYVQGVIDDTLQGARARDKEDTICWKNHIKESDGKHIRNDMYNLFKMILQGPVLQFARKSDISSLRALSSICFDGDLTDLIYALRMPQVLLNNAAPSETNILSSLRNLKAGMLSIIELEKEFRGSSARKCIGAVLKACEELVVKFFSFYDKEGRKESAFLFRDRWRSSDTDFLLRKMKKDYVHGMTKKSICEADHFSTALMTGAYFPDRPQVRPLPFNDEEVNETDLEPVETCSKDFFQRQKSFTPGALTFCCSCSHPKILGFKVLHKNEGPRAVLDTVVSRFGATPKHLVYDFCCGLFVSAIHCLWWALSHTYVVCDNFHVKNHTCSPGFYPRLHTALNSTNTVAHEQRNRAITKLGISLRNCKQDLYISLLGYQTIVLNIKAQAKSTLQFQNRKNQFQEFDIEWSYFHCLQHTCKCCFTI